MFGKKKDQAQEDPKKGGSGKPAVTSTAKPADKGATGGAKGAEPAKPADPRAIQEMKREAYLKSQAEKRQKLAELQQKKAEKEKAHKEELKKKQTMTMITFCIGLVVMLTALIVLFPSTEMIIFSTLLMFTFFFLGISYQRIIMQLMVVALACMLITAAFYTILAGGSSW